MKYIDEWALTFHAECGTILVEIATIGDINAMTTTSTCLIVGISAIIAISAIVSCLAYFFYSVWEDIFSCDDDPNENGD